MAGLQTAHNSIIGESVSTGFQNYIKQPLISVPYTGIVGRAQIVDPANDLKANFGIEPIMTPTVYRLQNEFGPANQPVWAATNDDRGLIRFVGWWWNATGGGGYATYTPYSGDYVEVYAYGTGLNILTYRDTVNRDMSVTVDGGSPYTVTNTGSGVLTSHYYGMNVVINVAENLAAGLHYFKIASTNTNNFWVHGIQILNSNASGNILINPGTAYAGGTKYTNNSVDTLPYTTGLPGGYNGKGARVVHYISATDTIAQAYTTIPTSPSTYPNADHSNEEIIEVYPFRSFGSGTNQTNTFDQDYGASDRVYCMDDGTTTLTGYQVQPTGAFSGWPEALYISAGSYVTLTFVGTGLDVFIPTYGGQNWDDLAFTVDGGSTISTTFTSAPKNIKYISGLPFGTHNVRITRGGTSYSTPCLLHFTVYGPKKPTVPTGCIEICDFNVMANYVQGTVGKNNIATGVLRKSSGREFTYTGSGWNWLQDVSSPSGGAVSGYTVYSNTGGDSFEYVFFGTGLEYRAQSDSGRSTNVGVQLQALSTGGSLLAATTTNFPTLSSAVYGGFSYNSGTGALNTSSSLQLGSGLKLSGLPLGTWKVKFTQNGSGYLAPEALDIITPVYKHKNLQFAEQGNFYLIGSNSLGDSRKFTPVKVDLPSTKAWVQAFGIIGNPSTGNGTACPIPDMQVTIKTSGGPIQIYYAGFFANNNGCYSQTFYIYVDGLQAGLPKSHQMGCSLIEVSDCIIVPVSAGVHKVGIYWQTSSGVYCYSNQRNMWVREL